MPRLFISHSGHDNALALAFQSWLTTQGWPRDEVFLDLHSIGAGEKWRETLRKANAVCEAVVLLASPEALESVECQKELELAEALGKEIICGIARGLSRNDPRLSRYRDRQFVDLTAEPRDTHIEPFEYADSNGTVRVHRLAFNSDALASIKGRLDDLGIAPGSFPWPPRGIASPEPYPGLSAFSEDDAGIFFGREAEIMAALTDVRQVARRRSPRLIMIDAASGAGKSSFLRAGLWPRLKRNPEFAPLAILRPAQGIISGPEGIGRRLAPWFERHAKPRTAGAIYTPLLNGTMDAASTSLAGLFSDAVELATDARRAARSDAKSPILLIAIDQAEELFAAENSAESDRFMEVLARVLGDLPTAVDLYVVVTIRADSKEMFLTRTAALGLETPKAIYLPPLSTSAYRDVILRPAQIYTDKIKRLEIDPILVARLAEQTRGADALPQLAFTLGRLFADYGAAGLLSAEQYEEMGGTAGTIRRALSDAQAKAGAAGSDAHLKRLLIPRLITWDPHADMGKGAAKRLVASRDDVLDRERADLVLLANSLVEKRLLSRTDRALEVAHEALLRQPPIDGWLHEAREFLMWRDGIAKSRSLFEANKRGHLIGRELQISRSWLEVGNDDGDVPAADRTFVVASIHEDDLRRDAEAVKEEKLRIAEVEIARLQQRDAARREKEAHDKAAVAMELQAAAEERAKTSAEREFVATLKAQVHQKRRLRTLFLALVMGAMLLPSLVLYSIAVAERDRASTGHWLTLFDNASRDGMVASDLKYLLTAVEVLEDATQPGPDATIRWISKKLVDGLDAVAPNLLKKPRSEQTRDLITVAEKIILSGLNTRSERSLLVTREAQLTSLAQFRGDRSLLVFGDEGGHLILKEAGDEKTKIERPHNKRINSIRLDPGNRFILTSSHDGTAVLSDLKSGLLRHVLKGHDGIVYSARFSHSGEIVATASHDQTVRLWRTATGESLRNLSGHTDRVTDVVFSPDDRFLISSSDDHTLKVWDTRTGVNVRTLEGHGASVYALDIHTESSTLVSSGADGIPQVWSLKSKEVDDWAPIHSGGLQLHEAEVTSFALSADGKKGLSGSADESAKLWNLTNGTSIATLKKHRAEVTSTALSPDASLAATASADGIIHIWDGNTGAHFATLVGHNGQVNRMEFGADGKHMTSIGADGTARQWFIGRHLATDTFNSPMAHSGAIVHSMLSAEKRLLATAGLDKRALLWDLTARQVIREIEHQEAVWHAQISPTGRYLGTASDDKTAIILDIHSNKRTVLAKPGHSLWISTLFFSPDEKTVVTASGDRTARVWNVETGKTIFELKGHTEPVRWALFDPLGKTIATNSWDGRVKLWDSKTGKEIWDYQAGHRQDMLAFDALGSRLVSVGIDGVIHVLNASDGTLERKIISHSDAIHHLAFNADGSWLVTSSRDRTARIFDMKTGQTVHVLRGHSDAVLSAEFAEGDLVLLTTSKDASAKIWDLSSGGELGSIAHSEAVVRGHFVADYTDVVTASKDRSIRRWQLDFSREIFVPLYRHDAKTNPRHSGTNRIPVATVKDLLQLARQLVPRCLSKQERLEFLLEEAVPKWCLEMKKWPYHKRQDGAP